MWLKGKKRTLQPRNNRKKEGDIAHTLMMINIMTVRSLVLIQRKKTALVIQKMTKIKRFSEDYIAIII